MSVVHVVKDLLNGMAGSVFIDDMPAKPDRAACIYATGGFPRDLVGGMVEEPTFMIHVRDPSRLMAEDTAEAIKDALHGVNNYPVQGAGTVLLIAQMGDINYIGRDENHRAVLSLNFRAYYRREG